MYQPPLSEAAQARLKIMRATNDGFIIAEEDLQLRGPGEVLAASPPAGIPSSRFGLHGNLLPIARAQAERILKNLPLEAAEMQPYLTLLACLNAIMRCSLPRPEAGHIFMLFSRLLFRAVFFFATAFFLGAEFLPDAVFFASVLPEAVGAGGVTTPPDTTSLTASSTLIFR